MAELASSRDRAMSACRPAFAADSRARPLADQGLVGDLHQVVAASQEPVLGESIECRSRGNVAIGIELGDGDPAPDGGLALPGANEAEKDGLRRLALCIGELLVGAL